MKETSFFVVCYIGEAHYTSTNVLEVVTDTAFVCEEDADLYCMRANKQAPPKTTFFYKKICFSVYDSIHELQNIQRAQASEKAE